MQPHLIITKGAFDTVIACCDRVAAGTGHSRSTPCGGRRCGSIARPKAMRDIACLGLATKRTAAEPRYDRHDETGMVFEGFLLFFDPLKEGIEDHGPGPRGLGIAVKIVTGDNRHVAAHVAAAVGLDTSRRTDRCNSCDDDARRSALASGRARPMSSSSSIRQQKERIVRALQHRGHAVAYLGDGINDAPPCMPRMSACRSIRPSTSRARRADIVLLQRDLGVLRDGIVDGRRTFVNTLEIRLDHDLRELRQHDQHGGRDPVSCRSCRCWRSRSCSNNFLSDVPSLALSTDNVDPGRRRPRPPLGHQGNPLFMLVFGLISTAFDLATFALLLGYFQAGEALFQTTWFVVSVLTELAVVLVLRTHLPCWQAGPAVCWSFPPSRSPPWPSACRISARPPWVFGLVPLPLPLLGSGIAIVVLYVLATEIGKRWFYGRVARMRSGEPRRSCRRRIERRWRGPSPHSALAPTERTTLPNFRSRLIMNAANSAGDAEDSAVAPWSLIALTMSGLRVAWVNAVCSLLIAASGVPAGATSPNQASSASPAKPGFLGGRDRRQDRHALFGGDRDGARPCRTAGTAGSTHRRRRRNRPGRPPDRRPRGRRRGRAHAPSARRCAPSAFRRAGDRWRRCPATRSSDRRACSWRVPPAPAASSPDCRPGTASTCGKLHISVIGLKSLTGS